MNISLKVVVIHCASLNGFFLVMMILFAYKDEAKQLKIHNKLMIVTL